MDFQNLYLSTSGRIGQKSFWIGQLILFGISIVLGFIGGMIAPGNAIVSAVLGLVLLYPGYCVMAKRFQDMGKTGKMAAIPYGASLLVQIFALITTMGLMGAAATGSDAAAAGAMAGLAGMGLVGIIGLVVWLVFLFWAGLTKGDAGPNAYGPPPAGAAPAA